jgi:ribosomal protein S1/(E)-4-hydroxy-3-methyl-but-2-enyl pyrophosphate reductase
MKVIFAKFAGFCYGVSRAVDIAEEASRRGKCCTLGPLIHNRQTTSLLREKGVCQAESIEDLPEGAAVIIRSHGAGKRDYDALTKRGFEIVDATCPNVSRIHDIVRKAALSGREAVIIGTAEHPEVLAICGWCEDARVFKNAQELDNWLNSNPKNRNIPITVVYQTTETRNNLEQCNKLIKKECTNCEVFDTICGATSMRQSEAEKLSGICDAMLVLGGRSSANSLRLAEICAGRCKNVFFAETAEDIDIRRLAQFGTVGVTAGASTPAWIIKEVYNKMSEEIKDMETVAEATELQEVAENTAEKTEEKAQKDNFTEDTDDSMESSFAELLEQNLKTLNNGDKVIGTVARISATEVSVDLGSKHSAYIPVAELSDDPGFNVNDMLKVGDEIEAYVVRVNDVEGTAMLSKKRLDAVKSWDTIETARVDRITVEGIVTEENKGGVVVSVKGVRVFVPASQSGLPKEAAMTQLLKKKVKLRITEVNRSRRRVVGSIRAAQFDERRGAADKVWDTIEVGAKYPGIVKSLTAYGAFVDIGGVDGMVHVSELRWKRTRNPADVIKVGDEIDVIVLSFDKEKKRISLTCKDPEKNPWALFTSEYSVGSIVKVKIVKLMTFGAFAEIIPGVDGLIHISQIADRRIGSAAEVLRDGQEVDVKIIEIDNEKKKVSLSIRALLTADEPVRDTEASGENKVVYDTENPPTEE